MYTKFAVESDSKKNISQNVLNLGFDKKYSKKLNFSKTSKVGKFAVENDSNDISQKWVFHLNGEISCKRKIWKIRKHEKKVF